MSILNYTNNFIEEMSLGKKVRAFVGSIGNSKEMRNKKRKEFMKSNKLAKNRSNQYTS